MTKRRDVLKGIGSGAAVIAMGGVASARGPDDDGDDDEGDGDAKVRVAHASPDAPAVDVYVGNDPEENDPTIENLGFEDVTGYLEIAAGEYEVTITKNEGEAAIKPTPVTLDLDAEDYTVAAIGELTPDVTTESFRPDVFQDKLGTLDDGDGRVRVYHASPDAPPVDVKAVDDKGEPILTLASDLAFGEAGQNAEVGAGDYDVNIYPAGEDSPVNDDPYNVEITDGEVLTVFAEGFLDGEPAFKPVLAYEEAAPFGNSDDNPGRGNG